MSFFKFLGARLFQATLVMLVVSLLSFVVFLYIGDPISSLVGQDATVERRAALRAEIGLDDPVILQFVRFLERVVQGDFGVSYQYGIPVLKLIMSRLPATLELAMVASVISVGLGVGLGIFSAVRPRSRWTSFVMTTSLIGVSLPVFMVGIGLIYIFAVKLGVLPSFGRGETVDLGWWTTGFLTTSGLKSLILPAVTLGLYNLTLLLRFVRAEMAGVLKTDFIRFARARGLSARQVYFKHGLRNILPPLINIIALQMGGIISFAVVTETVFQWPGVGQLFLSSVSIVDVPLISAYLVLVGLMFVIINLGVDLLCYMIDPRLRAA